MEIIQFDLAKIDSVFHLIKQSKQIKFRRRDRNLFCHVPVINISKNSTTHARLLFTTLLHAITWLAGLLLAD